MLLEIKGHLKDNFELKNRSFTIIIRPSITSKYQYSTCCSLITKTFWIEDSFKGEKRLPPFWFLYFRFTLGGLHPFYGYNLTTFLIRDFLPLRFFEMEIKKHGLKWIMVQSSTLICFHRWSVWLWSLQNIMAIL